MLHKPWVRNLIIFGAAVGAIVMMLALKEVVVPIFIAVVIGYLGDPIIDKFEEWKIDRTWGIVILLTLLTLAGGGLFWYVIPRLIAQLQELINTFPEYWNLAQERFLPYLTKYINEHPEQVEEVKASAITWLQENAGRLLTDITSGLAKSFASVGAFIANILSLIIIPVLAFYFLRDFDMIKEKAAHLIPLKRRAFIVGLATELDQALGNFIKGQLLVALILSLIYSVGLTIAGCPASLLIGLLAGFSNLIPYLGLALGFIPSVLLTYLSGNPMWQVIFAGGTFVAGQMLEGMVITPKVVGETVGLHPVVVMIALMIGGSYFGFVGMILALPVSAMLLVVLRRLYTYYVGSILYHEGELLPIDDEQDAKDIPAGL